MSINRICIFCGSSMGIDPGYASAAIRLSEFLVGQKIGIVYGGSNVGLMRIIADTAIRQGWGNHRRHTAISGR